MGFTVIVMSLTFYDCCVTVTVLRLPSWRYLGVGSLGRGMGVVRCEDGQGQLSLGGGGNEIGWEDSGGLQGLWGSVFGISGCGVGFLMLPEG